MPIDKQALADFIGAVRKDESSYKGAGARAKRMQRVVGATGTGTPLRGELVEAITGTHGISEDPADNRFYKTRTAEMFRGLLSDEEVNNLLDGEGGPQVGLQKIAALLYERLGKLGVNEQFRGEFLGDVMNRFEARLKGQR